MNNNTVRRDPEDTLVDPPGVALDVRVWRDFRVVRRQTIGRRPVTGSFVSRRMPRLTGLSTRTFLRPAVLLPFLAAALVWFTMLGEQDINRFWSEYRVYVIGAAVIVTLQASMIAALVVQRQRRRRAEADLRESEVRFRSMADMVPVLIWIANVDGNVTFLNKGWQDFVGDAAQRALLDTWTSCVHPDDLRIA